MMSGDEEAYRQILPKLRRMVEEALKEGPLPDELVPENQDISSEQRERLSRFMHLVIEGDESGLREQVLERELVEGLNRGTSTSKRESSVAAARTLRRRRAASAEVDARTAAEQILEDKRLGRNLPTDLHELAGDEYVDVEFFEGRELLDGRLKLVDGKPAAFVNTHGRPVSDGRVRFTWAHELGHFFLHRSLLYAGETIEDEEVKPDYDGSDVREKQANEFASEVLLPRSVLDRELGQDYIVTLDLIVGVAEKALTSLQATAIRLVRNAHDRCCVFLVVGDVVRWTAPSDDWRYLGLPCSKFKGKRLPNAAHAARTADDYRERSVKLSSWAPKMEWRDSELFESSLTTSYGRLVLLGASDTGTDPG